MNIKQWRILVIALALASLALCLAPFWQAYFSEKLVGPPTQTQSSSIEKATISATHDLLIFVRYFLTFQPDAFRPSGLYVYDIQSDQISILEETTLKVYGLSRSPKADGIVYQSGNEIYLIGFDGSARMIGESYAVLERRGYALCWLPDGMSVLYETSSGELTVLQVYKDVEPIAYGGETESWNLNLYPAYYFRPGDLNE